MMQPISVITSNSSLDSSTQNEENRAPHPSISLIDQQPRIDQATSSNKNNSYNHRIPMTLTYTAAVPTELNENYRFTYHAVAPVSLNNTL
jgi:hypothetical protein